MVTVVEEPHRQQVSAKVAIMAAMLPLLILGAVLIFVLG
jgi:hypothetical protein